ncbi:hypothetical protein [Bradyrhizobium embrapense]|uniref:hypothetical protein n=1 Tax=Bradyrhizobium embrapense TaxID=630921 RepID=UPI000ACBAF54|nr:hypothetical protein [Bradyrhizobium embrapense]
MTMVLPSGPGYKIPPVLFWGGLMKKDDVTCPRCGAGFRRLELTSGSGSKGEYRCPVCETTLEQFGGDKLVAYRLTIQPSIRGLKAG